MPRYTSFSRSPQLKEPRTATVVGSGPNGLAAAVVLADAGLSVTVLEAEATIGGGTRSSELIHSGVTHDLCSAAHPLAQATPFYHHYANELTDFGLHFATAEVDMVHVLDRYHSASLHRSVEATADGFCQANAYWDSLAWKTAFGSLADHADEIADEFLRPMLHVPRHPLLFAKFASLAASPASLLGHLFRRPQARALFTGIAAHAFTSLDHPGSSAAGALLTVVGHRYGWPVAVGGSQNIANALSMLLEARDGKIVTGFPVTEFAQVADSDIVILDTSISCALSILSERIPNHIERSWSKFRHGPGVAKVDYLIEGNVPWLSADARRAGTVHLGGESQQIAESEKKCWKGHLPERPFTLVGQQYLADPSRSAFRNGQKLNPLWAYAHVPAKWDGNEIETIELVTAQIEREAPGFREQILGQIAHPPAAIEAGNRNYVGGDICGGANDLSQLLARPRLSPDPYFTGVPGVYLCSSSVAPGGGVHFMGGMNAAFAALQGYPRSQLTG